MLRLLLGLRRGLTDSSSSRPPLSAGFAYSIMPDGSYEVWPDGSYVVENVA
jgi:hypothetical protein